MMDDGWNVFGVPHIVTSDQGPQFAGMWWKTMCRRLGIRQAFSQAHRPQSNGRAERAGQQIMKILRKMNVGEGINWVGALPHALRLYHDCPGPTGWSPYEIVFGRERSLADFPRRGAAQCEEAADFFNRMQAMDTKIAKELDKIHAAQQGYINEKRREGHQHRVGDKVWVIRPKQLGGNKISPWWLGPYPIVAREGERSFVVLKTPTETLSVHADQLKPWYGEDVEGPGIPIVYRQKDPGDTLPMEVEGIRTHRESVFGLEFLVQWKGASPQADSWEPVASFVRIKSDIWWQYCEQHQVPITVETRSGVQFIAESR